MGTVTQAQSKTQSQTAQQAPAAKCADKAPAPVIIPVAKQTQAQDKFTQAAPCAKGVEAPKSQSQAQSAPAAKGQTQTQSQTAQVAKK